MSVVKPNRCTIFEFTEYQSTCFGRSFRPSSGVLDSTNSIGYMSYWLVDCLLAGTRRKCSSISCPLASSQLTSMTYTMLCVLSRTPDDGREDSPKHVEWCSVNSKIVRLVGFIIETYHDARYHEGRTGQYKVTIFRVTSCTFVDTWQCLKELPASILSMKYRTYTVNGATSLWLFSVPTGKF